MLFKVITFLAMVFCLLIMFEVLSVIDLSPNYNTAEYQILAEQLNLQNMVTAIYLGPRLLDTFLEVFVVVLSVIGIKYLKE